MILLGLIAMNKAYFAVLPKVARGCLRPLVYSLGFILFLIYCMPIAKGQYHEGKATYGVEVQQNQGLRMTAARWLSSNTPKDAKILVGYTGLGVVGGDSQRYVYDMGALINPDILPYLKGTVHLSPARWSKVLEYVCAKKINYFVSSAPMLGQDPAQSPGFVEKVRIGVENPEKAFQQIRVYTIDPNQLCK